MVCPIPQRDHNKKMERLMIILWKPSHKRHMST